VNLLSDPAHDGKVLREVGREDPRDPVCIEVLELVHLVCVKGLLEDVLHGILGGLERVLFPGLAIVRAEDDNLALLVAEGGKVRDLDDHGAVGLEEKEVISDKNRESSL
jgi:hypothetical protein